MIKELRHVALTAKLAYYLARRIAFVAATDGGVLVAVERIPPDVVKSIKVVEELNQWGEVIAGLGLGESGDDVEVLH